MKITSVVFLSAIMLAILMSGCDEYGVQEALKNLDKYVAELDNGKSQPNTNTSSEPKENSISNISWDGLKLSEIYDGEIYDGSEINYAWMNKFRVKGNFVTIEGSYEDGIINQGVILSDKRIVIIHNNQYIILDDPDDIKRIGSEMNINFDKGAINLIKLTGNWDYAKDYLPFMSNDAIEEVVKLYNSNHPASQHKNAEDYFN
ncbi:MAG: hypothetical protein FWG90_05555 [Oscillospiraceae bacterium]|nr:hypothetical protein [Oscillospiraceae bacterium]